MRDVQDDTATYSSSTEKVCPCMHVGYPEKQKHTKYRDNFIRSSV